jgi:medium-chain acyl-[acyl-carrier-protein] hydrolase
MLSQNGSVLISAWTTCPKPNPGARLRLFCFPYAGAGASVFAQWARAMPAEIELHAVQLPGRETRLRETLYKQFPPLIEALSEALHPLLDKPFAFFGHSLGALISFETARRLRQQYGQEPSYMFVSARRSPRLPEPGPALHALPDAAFITQMQQRYNGIPQVILQDRELMQLFLPIIRADMELLEGYRYVDEQPFKCAFSAFGGWEDKQASEAELLAWRSQTLNSFTVKMFPGSHFFLQTARAELLQALTQYLRPFLN